MGHPDYRTCKGCGRSGFAARELSWTRLCSDCGDRRLQENFVALKTMRGPFAQHWRQRTAASVIPPDVMAALAAVGVFGVDEGEPKA